MSEATAQLDCGVEQHDHNDCVELALRLAEETCALHGAKLTALRRRVLELVWQSGQPVGAYALMDSLRREGQAAQPPTVYRALDFLLAQGLVHRLESRNAFVGCNHPGTVHSSQFLICVQCGRSEELEDPAIAATIVAAAQKRGFSVVRQSVEVEGTCSSCS
jgi:Fur family zinc uptake transcriptional regulator